LSLRILLLAYWALHLLCSPDRRKIKLREKSRLYIDLIYNEYGFFCQRMFITAKSGKA
jgi:hypothetical protein